MCRRSRSGGPSTEPKSAPSSRALRPRRPPCASITSSSSLTTAVWATSLVERRHGTRPPRRRSRSGQHAVFFGPPGAVVPAHIDRYHNLLFQIRARSASTSAGSPDPDRQQAEIERDFDGTAPRAQRAPTGAVQCGARPGDGVYIPPYAFHWTKSGADVSSHCPSDGAPLRPNGPRERTSATSGCEAAGCQPARWVRRRPRPAQGHRHDGRTPHPTLTRAGAPCARRGRTVSPRR